MIRFARPIAQLGRKRLNVRIVSPHPGHGGALAVLRRAPMKNARSLAGVTAALSLALAAPLSAQTRTAAGPYEAVIDRVFPLAEALAAQELMSSNQSFGKIVLSVP